MSYQSVILSVCVPPAELPAELCVFADVTALYSDRHPACHSFSRWTIASQHLDALVEAFRADDLTYLRETAVVLDRAAIARAVDALESLFEQMSRDPERAIACSVYECSVDGVLEAASAPERNPVPDVPDDDEGESLPYAIAYLKAHRSVLRHALDHDLAVAYGQSHRLDGSEA